MPCAALFKVVVFCALQMGAEGVEPATSGSSGQHVSCSSWVSASRAGSSLVRSQSSGDGAIASLAPGWSVRASCHYGILELGPGEVRPGNLLDLEGQSIRFVPDAGGYRVAHVPFAWDGSYGSQLTGEPSQSVPLLFAFPFSGASWTSAMAGTHGVMTFGAPQSAFYDPSANRFLLFRDFAGAMTNTVPLISPLFRKLGVYDPDGVNRRWAKSLPDRAVFTWEMSEPYRDVFAFATTARLNRFQATLYPDGAIEFAYQQLMVGDGIVGVFPVEAAQASWSESDPADPDLPGYLDALNVALSVVDADTLRATFVVRDGPPAPGNPVNDDLLYRVFLDTDAPYTTVINFGDADVDFGVFGDMPDYGYYTYSQHVDLSSLAIEGRTLSFDVAAAILGSARTFSYFADTPDFNQPAPNFDHVAGTVVRLPPVLGAITEAFDPAVPAYVDQRSVAATLVGNHSIRFTFTLRGELPPPGDPRVQDNVYRVFVDLDQPFVSGVDFNDFDIEWGVFGGPDLQYHAFGPGVSPVVSIDAAAVSIVVPIARLGGATQFAFFTDSVDFSLTEANFDQGSAVMVSLPPMNLPNVDLSAATPAEPPRHVIYEAFYYPDVPDEREMSAAVISALGDRFDFLAFYTDFRIDRQETGSSFSGAIGNKVQNAVPVFHQPADWGSAGQLQGVQLVNWIATPLAAPSGADLSGPYTEYRREVALLCHELGHRWLSIASAVSGGQTIPISDPAPHWLQGLHAPALVPANSPTDASFMGGSYWQDNGNGTFTNLTQPFFVAGGYSPLDLYYMGLLARQDVPPFFLVENAAFSHTDGQGRTVYTGQRRNLTVDDVIAYSGPRLPEFANSQRVFNIGLIGVVQSGFPPSPMIRDRLDGIAHAFTRFWTKSTAGAGVMHAVIRGDSDDDRDIDADDLAAFRACATRAAVPQPVAACRSEFDFDEDGDVDLSDFGQIQACVSGSP